MTIEIGIDDKKKIYNNSLKTIKGYNFTLREIDIISAILHHRKEKQIASILSISPRTVSVHVHNILSKMGYNSKDYLIDFIEKSGKLELLRQYYIYNIIENTFTKTLEKLSKLHNIQNIDFDSTESSEESEPSFLNALKLHLEKLNIKLSISNGKEEANKIPCLTYDDFYSPKDYYKVFLNFFRDYLNDSRANQIIDEFFIEYEALKESLKQISYKQINVDIKENTKQKILNHKYKIVLSIMLILAVCSFYIFNHYKNQEFLLLLDTFLSDNKTSLVDNNIPKAQRQKNYDIAKKIEKILFSADKDLRNRYFNDENMSSDKILTYTYNLHALSSYYMYHEHNGEKSRELMLHAKQVILDYLNRKNIINVDFDKLSIEELYSELSLVQDFPEIYTRIMYSLGRTYIYQGNLEESRKYFGYSNYLGKKIGLFEGFLADVSGLCILDSDLADDYIKNNENDKARKILLRLIEKYKLLKEDNTKYKISYIPGSFNPKTIIPSEDAFNIYRCNIRSIKHYRSLILISKDAGEKQIFADKILSTFMEISKDFILDGKLDDNILSSREIARIYNMLGDVLLTLLEENISHKKFQDELIPLFLFTKNKDISKDYLDVIEMIFQQGCNISSINDFTKADSYAGIIRTKEKKLELINLVLENKEERKGQRQKAGQEGQEREKILLKKEIELLYKKKNEINQALKRKEK